MSTRRMESLIEIALPEQSSKITEHMTNLNIDRSIVLSNHADV